MGAFRDECLKNKEKIEKEQEEANNDLQAALPYLREAEEAVKSITPKDIGELKSMKTPSDIIRLVFDGVLILLQNKLVEVRPEMKNINKKQIEFIHDSFDESAKAMMADVHFLSNLFDFSQVSSHILSSSKPAGQGPVTMLLLPWHASVGQSLIFLAAAERKRQH